MNNDCGCTIWGEHIDILIFLIYCWKLRVTLALAFIYTVFAFSAWLILYLLFRFPFFALGSRIWFCRVICVCHVLSHSVGFDCFILLVARGAWLLFDEVFRRSYFKTFVGQLVRQLLYATFIK